MSSRFEFSPNRDISLLPLSQLSTPPSLGLKKGKKSCLPLKWRTSLLVRSRSTWEGQFKLPQTLLPFPPSFPPSLSTFPSSLTRSLSLGHLYRGEIVEFDLNTFATDHDAVEMIVDIFESGNVKVELWTTCALECVSIGKLDDAELIINKGLAGEFYFFPSVLVGWGSQGCEGEGERES